jgi:hypothetical protein
MPHRIDPERGTRCFDGPMIEQEGPSAWTGDNWGQGQKLVEIHEDEFAAEQALEALTQLERQ